MKRPIRRFTGTIAAALFLLLLGVLLSLPETAHARGYGQCLAESSGPDSGGAALSPDRLERWRSMSPEERDRIRERYRRWKELTPEQRERVKARHRRWRELPEEQRSYLRERRALLREAGPEEQAVVRSFFARMHSLPPEVRRATRQKVWEWQSLPPGEREEAMRSWPFYGELSGPERETLRWFLFARPGESPPRE